MKNINSNVFKGTIYAILAGAFWAFSGIFGQLFFQQFATNALWITSFRLLVAGAILLVISYIHKPQNFFDILKHKQNYLELFSYAILGMLMLQVSFYACIQVSNAATATVLQFTSPVFILIYLAVFKGKRLTAKLLSLVVITILGIFFITTHGNIASMSLIPKGVVLGFISAIAVAFCSLIPSRLLQTYDVMNVTGWGMLIAGLIINVVHPVWVIDIKLTPKSFILALRVAVIGTAVAFMLNMTAIKYISPVVAEVCAAMEPILASVFSIFLFNMPFDFLTGLSMLVVLTSVSVLSLEEGKL